MLLNACSAGSSCSTRAKAWRVSSTAEILRERTASRAARRVSGVSVAGFIGLAYRDLPGAVLAAAEDFRDLEEGAVRLRRVPEHLLQRQGRLGHVFPED